MEAYRETKKLELSPSYSLPSGSCRMTCSKECLRRRLNIYKSTSFTSPLMCLSRDSRSLLKHRVSVQDADELAYTTQSVAFTWAFARGACCLTWLPINIGRLGETWQTERGDRIRKVSRRRQNNVIIIINRANQPGKINWAKLKGGTSKAQVGVEGVISELTCVKVSPCWG